MDAKPLQHIMLNFSIRYIHTIGTAAFQKIISLKYVQEQILSRIIRAATCPNRGPAGLRNKPAPVSTI